MPSSTFRYTAGDGQQITAYRWDPPSTPRAAMQVTHGMGEHALRYEDFAEAMNGGGLPPGSAGPPGRSHRQPPETMAFPVTVDNDRSQTYSLSNGWAKSWGPPLPFAPRGGTEVMDDFTDVTYEVDHGLAWVTINRPERYNSFRARTVDELVMSFKKAWGSDEVGVIALTGAGEKAFCTGGDQKQRMETGDYGPSESGLFEIESLHRVIRDVPKPVIAAVNGFAIGGGHVLHLLCDLTIAADTAKFGQNGPRVGSFDAGFGTGLMARAIGEKRAREIWFLCRQYSAQQAVDWGLANKAVPPDQLHSEVRAWADEILRLSPTALKVLKQSFNTDTEHFAAIGNMAYSSLKMFGETAEAQEGIVAFNEKRAPDFSTYRGN